MYTSTKQEQYEWIDIYPDKIVATFFFSLAQRASSRIHVHIYAERVKLTENAQAESCISSKRLFNHANHV